MKEDRAKRTQGADRAGRGTRKVAEAKASYGTTRDRLEGSLLARVSDLFRESVRQMSDEEIMRAVEAHTPAATVVQVISAAPEVGLARESGWTRAMARGAVRKQEMIERAGGVYSSSEAAALIGITVSAVNLRRKRGRILAVPLSGGEWGFPARQFAEGEVRAGVADVVEAASGMNPWVLLSILLEPVQGADGLVILDRLDDDGVRAAVLARVRDFGSHGAV